MILPPGFTEQTFSTALEAFRAAIGDEWVFASDEQVTLYRDAYSPLWDTDLELRPSAAVAPANVDEVQAVVRIANELGLPVFPISTGKNLGYGGSAPNLSGSVIIDLKRLNKIIEVDDRRNFAIVEPGVSYFDLYEYIEANNLAVFMDCPDPGWGSVLGNALEHGNGFSFGHYRDHFSVHAGLEAVLPDGSLMRTGMAAVPGTKSWAENKWGYGAHVDGLFAQANFGIVTKMGIWLMPKPEFFMSARVKVKKYRDIIPLVDVVNSLEDQGLIGYARYQSPMDMMTIMMEPQRYQITDELVQIHGTPGGATVAQFEDYAESHGLEYWSVLINYYGPKETCESNWAYTQRLLKDLSGAEFSVEQAYALPLTDEQKEKISHSVTLGIPNMEIFSIGARQPLMPEPGDGHVWFAPIIPRSGEALIEAHDVFISKASDLGLGNAPISRVSAPAGMIYRTFLFLFPFFVSRSDDKVNAEIRRIYPELIRIAAEHGWTEYRAAPFFQDAVMATYSFNDNRLLRFQETLKDAIDPNGILAPGRGGIWPQKYRKER